jgi:hypothetical protein
MIASQCVPSSFVRVPSILDICLGSPHHNQAFSQTGGFGVLMAQGTWLYPRNLDSAANQASRRSIGVRQACSLSGEARRVLPSAGRFRRWKHGSIPCGRLLSRNVPCSGFDGILLLKTSFESVSCFLLFCFRGSWVVG